MNNRITSATSTTIAATTRKALVIFGAILAWAILANCASTPPVSAAAPAPEVIVATTTDEFGEDKLTDFGEDKVDDAIVDVTPAAPGITGDDNDTLADNAIDDEDTKKLLAQGERDKALAAMARADELKGKTAGKQAYAAGASAFRNGDKNMGFADYDAARFDFHSAAETFNLLADTLVTKRAQALDALARAQIRSTEAEAFALAADAVSPLAPEAP
jgi:hypothetical protein